MKEQYQDLNILIDIPTQGDWDAVHKFFELENLMPEENIWDCYKERTCIWISNEAGRRYWAFSPASSFSQYEIQNRFTFEQFKQQYMTPEKQTIDVSGLPQRIVDVIQDIADYERSRLPEPPKKVTAKELCKDLPELVGEPLQCTAFRRLLHCAEWANSHKHEKDTEAMYYPTWSYRESQFTKTIFGKIIKNNPLLLTACNYEPFMAIEGIERQLHIFLNTGVEG